MPAEDQCRLGELLSVKVEKTRPYLPNREVVAGATIHVIAFEAFARASADASHHHHHHHDPPDATRHLNRAGMVLTGSQCRKQGDGSVGKEESAAKREGGRVSECDADVPGTQGIPTGGQRHAWRARASSNGLASSCATAAGVKPDPAALTPLVGCHRVAPMPLACGLRHASFPPRYAQATLTLTKGLNQALSRLRFAIVADKLSEEPASDYEEGSFSEHEAISDPAHDPGQDGDFAPPPLSELQALVLDYDVQDSLFEACKLYEEREDEGVEDCEGHPIACLDELLDAEPLNAVTPPMKA
ncbi:hypothetical protein BC629DRAFT_1597380 [Irpex lacteus]|nr:hypothetical protein BC629DRAFT_1597380 [Irpex lacteus]